MKEVILGIWLGIQGCVDFKYKEIPLWFSMIGGVIGIGFCITEARAGTEILLACLPGAVALGFSWLTKEVIGYGDGIVLLVMGTYMSLRQLISIGLLAFFLAGIVALFLLVILRKNGNYRIPFIPFLSLAYGIECLVRLGGAVL